MEGYISDIQGVSSLRPASVKQYIANWKALVKRTGHSIDWVLSHPQATRRRLDELINDGEIKPETRRAYISSVIALFKHCAIDEAVFTANYAQWYREFLDVSQRAQEHIEQNEPTDRQREAHVPLDEIVAMRDSLPAGSLEQLLLAMYTMIPPARADYGQLRIYDRKPSEEQVAETPNYMVRTTRGKFTLYLNEYKTSEAYGAHVKVLPEELSDVIAESLRSLPREWLFVTPRGRGPFSSGEAFSEWVRGVLSRLFDRPLSINGLRHSYANSLDLNTLTVRELNGIARGMHHSVEQLRKYRKRF